MKKNSGYYQALLEKWAHGKISPQEAIELINYLQNDAANRPLLQQLQKEFQPAMDHPDTLPPELSKKLKHEILKKIEPAPVIPLEAGSSRVNWHRVAAAILILALGAASYFAFRGSEPSKEWVTAPKELPGNDVEAGTHKAILTLANGTQIELDDKTKGQLVIPGMGSVTNNDGKLVYDNPSVETNEMVYNTLSSARGQSYSLVLSDGSKLWLNAASSVRFPVVFSGEERKVDITGEVFFEVAKDARKPFKVKVKDMEIEVLGTRFDINTYPDELTVNTTLIEGAVKVSANNSEVRLSPGQQSQLLSNGNLQVVKNVNTDEIVAWKDGYFHFENADLHSILRQFSRWYDIEVVYEGELKNRKFLAIVSRNSSLASVLKMLNANNVQFRIEGKKLIVQSY
jgi:ferric-dicitrate binding protein FerR (iron transport regulator)